MKRLVAFLFLLFVACQHCGPRTGWATNDSDAGEVTWPELPVRWSFMCGTAPVPEFDSAADWWNRKLGIRVFEKVPEDVACLCIDAACPKMLVMEGLTNFDPYDVPDSGINTYARTHLLRGSTDIRAVVIKFYDPYWNTTDEAKTTIARHEMGHVLGLMHTDNERCLMYYTVERNLDTPKGLCDSERKAFMRHYDGGM